jgi:hypothetical protein
MQKLWTCRSRLGNQIALDGIDGGRARPLLLCAVGLTFSIHAACLIKVSPARAQPLEAPVPIRYVSLQPSHIQQVHDLLARAFWDGIDGSLSPCCSLMFVISSLLLFTVSDLLQLSPERCSVIAVYGKIVVGAALLSSPQEAYITYLAVRAGWDNSHIATSVVISSCL